jgi:histidinol-phosphate aminotransferase
MNPSILRSLFLHAGLAFAGLATLSAAPTDASSPLRLGSNENPFGYSPKAKEAVIRYIESANYYNRNEVDEMVRVCAEKEGVAPAYILPTAGSGPLLEMTGAAFGREGVNIVTAAPGYPQLTSTFAKWGGTIKYVTVNDQLGYDFKAMALSIDGDTSMVYICNPNNPTGVLADPAELRRFIMSVPAHVLVFVDEAYLELSAGGVPVNSMAPLVKVRRNLVVSRTFSKAYALAGFRAGYGIGHPDTLARLQRHNIGASPSYLAAIAAQEAVRDQAHLQENVRKYQEVRAYVCKEFDRMGLAYAKPEGAFILFKAGIDSSEFVKKMLDKKIMVTRPFGLGPLEADYADWVRVSIGTQEDMELFLGATASILGKT